jgi:hypothetical protein
MTTISKNKFWKYIKAVFFVVFKFDNTQAQTPLAVLLCH